MTITRPQEQIDAAIIALKANREVCPKTSFLGDDNLAAIDAMVTVLEERMELANIEARFYDPDTEYVLYNAQNAFEFMCGECELTDILFAPCRG